MFPGLCDEQKIDSFTGDTEAQSFTDEIKMTLVLLRNSWMAEALSSSSWLRQSCSCDVRIGGLNVQSTGQYQDISTRGNALRILFPLHRHWMGENK